MNSLEPGGARTGHPPALLVGSLHGNLVYAGNKIRSFVYSVLFQSG